MKKTIMILGSHSFSGACFMNMILKKNTYNIISVFNSRKKNLPPYTKYIDSNFESYKINLLKDINKLTDIVLKKRPNYIIDFASNCNVDLSWKDTEKITKINFLNKINFIKKINNSKFLKKYIYISTPEIFGSSYNFINENTTKFNPTSPYATSKLSFELFLKNYFKTFKFPLIISRFSNFYGEYQNKNRLIPKIINCILKKQKFTLQGKGDFLRSYIYIEDVCNGLEKIVQKGEPGNNYHFSTNQFFTTTQVIKLICKKYGLNFRSFIKYGKSRISQDKCYKLECKLTKKNLNWKPSYSLDHGIDKIYSYYKNRLK